MCPLGSHRGARGIPFALGLSQTCKAMMWGGPYCATTAGSWPPAHLPGANTKPCSALSGSFPEPAPIVRGKSWWTRCARNGLVRLHLRPASPDGSLLVREGSPPVSASPPSLGPLCVPWSLLGSEEPRTADEEGRRGSLLEQRVLWADLTPSGREEATGGAAWGTSCLSMLTAEAVSGMPLPLSLTPRTGQVCVPTAPGCSLCFLLKGLPGLGGRCFLRSPGGASRGSIAAQVLQKLSC